MKAACPSVALVKKMDKFAPTWAVIVNNSVGVFLSSKRDSEDKKGEMGSHPALGRPVQLPPPSPCQLSLFSLLFSIVGLGIKMDF